MTAAPAEGGAAARPRQPVATVVPDVSGVDREFDYLVPEALAGEVEVGSIVRVRLRGRSVRGWVVALSTSPPFGRSLLEVTAVVSRGPGADVVGLARFGAWRYSGRVRSLLAAASPPRVVRALPPPGGPTGERPPGGQPARAGRPDQILRAVEEALREGRAVIRVPPAASRLDVVTAVLAHRERGRGRAGGTVLVLVPERRDAEVLARRLRGAGREVATVPEEWASAAAGGRVVVGTRAAALATVPGLSAILVLDSHDESYVEQRAPTWSAWVLAAERARRARVPCVLVSPCPTLEQLAWGALVRLPRAVERSGWPPVELLDRRGEDPRAGLYSPRLAPLLASALDARPDLPALCVLDRTGRVRLLACGACGEIVRCAGCRAPLGQHARPEQGSAAVLECPTCRAGVPAICPSCGSTRLRALRVGASRAAEELAALTGREVLEVSGRPGAGEPGAGPRGLVVGTQAVLHRVRSASVVVFLDVDQELLAPRFRAAEQALALLARAARVVGAAPPRPDGPRPRVVVQTRLPDSEVLAAAAAADPGLLSGPERARREALGLPPTRALASLTGDGAEELAAALRRSGAPGIEIGARADGRRLVRASTPEALADALREVRGRGLDARVVVDPLDA